MPDNPFIDMLPDDVLDTLPDTDNSLHKGQPPKEEGQEIDVSDLLASGKAYEVPDIP